MDKGFVYHRAVTQLWTEVARNLLESVVLPMDLDWYATYLNESVAGIKNRYGAQLEANQATLTHFERAVGNFAVATRRFQDTTLARLDPNEYISISFSFEFMIEFLKMYDLQSFGCATNQRSADATGTTFCRSAWITQSSWIQVNGFLNYLKHIRLNNSEFKTTQSHCVCSEFQRQLLE